MLNAVQRAQQYFQSALDDPWRWAERGRVLVWADGSTIAFREELTLVLDELAPEGLPPFQAIALILAACRGKFPPSDPGSESKSYNAHAQLASPAMEPGLQLASRAWNDPANQEFSELLARLRALHQLPAPLKESPRAKAVLIESIFEKLNLSRVQPGRVLVKALREFQLDLNAPETSRTGLVPTLRLLHAGLRDFSAEALALRLRTGLDQLPEPAELELKPAQRARHLLAQLQRDPEHQGLAKVARDIMAALYVPRALSEMDELALGGFCDISNRGNLDRLLLSELANDDLTLATRIALNEALYIRREPPSNHPPARLALLIDLGLRQWGLPRLFGTAAALAFIARDEHCAEATLWQARRGRVERAELLSRSGLTDHLATLETYAHPGASLKPFFDQFAGQPDVEAVLVAHRDSIADPDFQRQLAEVTWGSFYIATVDRDGNFELFAHPHRHKPLCRAAISLESLFAPAPAKKARPSLRVERTDPDLPLILSVHPFPFLLPILGQVDKSAPLPNSGGVAVMLDRRLLRWDAPVLGAYCLSELLPPGKTIWVGSTDYGKKVHVLKYLNKSGAFSLTTWDGIAREVGTLEALSWRDPPARAFERDGVLFVIAASHIHAFDLHSPQHLGSVILLPGNRSPHGRYFVRPNGEWVCLGFDGHALRFDPIPIPKQDRSKILALFDRAGIEGLPWQLTNRGEIVSGEGKRIINLNVQVSFFLVAADGHRLLVNTAAEPNSYVINLQSGSITRFPQAYAQRMFDPPLAVPTRNVRIKFEEVFCAPNGALALKNVKGNWYTVTLEENSLRLTWLQAEPPADPRRRRKFEAARLPRHSGFTLKVARWADGSSAWLDSRGLLHLKQAARPEVSLMLAEGTLAAWSSDGKLCGPPFFVEGRANADAATLLERIQQFFPAL